MKTAISLPDPLFAEAESLAAELGVSRSALVARALRMFITRQRRHSVTQRLNAVYADTTATSDSVLVRAGLKSPSAEW